jgi:hypothetical protein
MLQNFLWFFSLSFGAYFTGLSYVVLSGGLLAVDMNFLQYSAMKQGNFLFIVLYFLTSLLLILGVHKVKNEKISC